MIFYVGIRPSYARYFAHACVSPGELRDRVADFAAGRWIMDSGAFTEIAMHGRYRSSVADHAALIRRWSRCGTLEAAVAQDFMCEPFILERTGLTIADHQRLTIERYDELAAERLPVRIMPVLQGYDPADYRAHVRAYGDRLAAGAWVGVGSVCKRNASPVDVANVLAAIAQERPDLQLHGFGVKRTALADRTVRALLYSADSMAWSFAARRQGRNGNDWREAQRFVEAVELAAREPVDAWQQVLAFEAAP